MCTVFKAAVRNSLPHATLVVDRFHVVQLANAALTEVRRRVTVQQRGRRGPKGNREWELRNRLTRSAARMHANQLDPMVEDLQNLPAPIGVPILAAWNCKKDLMDLLALTGTEPDRTVIAARLFRFYAACADSGTTRNGTPGHHHPHLVAPDRGRDSQRRQQRWLRRHQPPHQD
jgi:transposase